MNESRNEIVLLLSWHPEHVPYETPAAPGWSPCTRATPPRARGVVCEHDGGCRGVVAVCDFGNEVGVAHQ